jgi:hypothetical protein
MDEYRALVELQGENSKYLENNPSYYHFIHHKSPITWPGIEPGPPW